MGFPSEQLSNLGANYKALHYEQITGLNAVKTLGTSTFTTGTGTADTVAGSKVVTATGSGWIAGLGKAAKGMKIVVGTETLFVDRVMSDTELLLLEAAASTQANVAYTAYVGEHYRKTCSAVRVDIDAQNVRFRRGVDPTAAIGGIWLADSAEWIPQGMLDDLRCIEEAASAILNLTYVGM